MGRHSKGQQVSRQRGAVEMVDAKTLIAHVLTPDAAERGLTRGTYIATCAEVFKPAAMVAREAGYCPLCIPAQRSR